jgi:hypothetical protein
VIEVLDMIFATGRIQALIVVIDESGWFQEKRVAIKDQTTIKNTGNY